MKTLIIIVVCVVVANVQAVEVIQELIGNSIAECKEKVNATPEDMLLILQHKPPTTTSAKCLIACINKKFKIQNAAGEIDAKAAKETLKLAKFIGEDIYQQLIGIVDKCVGQVEKGGNECDIASSFFNCAIIEISATNIPGMLGDLLL